MAEQQPSLNQEDNVATTDMGWGAEHGPFRYHRLSEPLLSAELARLSLAKTQGRVDSVTFQPCLAEVQRSQDRLVVEEWDMVNGVWTFTAVFDGHAGHETVDFARDTLPSMIKLSLAAALEANASVLPPTTVSDVLSSSIKSLDDGLTTAVLDLFPGSPESLAALTDDEIRAVINDSPAGGVNAAKVMRCMRGSTALVALVDPARENLWVASLGDCFAVLGSTETSDNGQERVKATVLSSNHNGRDAGEEERIKSEHPGEDECVLKGRVLGAIAVTRALGDHLYKLPSIYTSRVFLNAACGFRFTVAKAEDILHRNITPPYLTNIADVRHVDLRSAIGEKVWRKPHHGFLVLCSDGLTDLYYPCETLQQIADTVVKVTSAAVDGEGAVDKENAALRLLRDALGGDDVEKVSRMVTVEMEQRWMDDTTIVVQRL